MKISGGFSQNNELVFSETSKAQP
jgi:hypothetical protein